MKKTSHTTFQNTNQNTFNTVPLHMLHTKMKATNKRHKIKTVMQRYLSLIAALFALLIFFADKNISEM